MEEMIDVLNSSGMLTGQVASRDMCHKEGLWHRAVVVFIINSKKQVLLQKRSANKKLWPNLWDITAGGHVLSNEFSFNSVIRETKEEIGLNINKEELLYIASTSSTDIKGYIINNHFNDYFIVHKDVDISSLTLQEEEVQDIKWFDKDDLIERINNNYMELTSKIDCWKYLKKYLEYLD